MNVQGCGKAVAWTACVDLTLSYFATDLMFHSFLTAQIFPSVPANLPISAGVSPDVGTSLFLQLPFKGCVSHPTFSFSFLLYFILLGYVEIFLVLSGVQGLLLVFSWGSKRTVPSVDVF